MSDLGAYASDTGLQGYELWTKLPADGGTRVGFLGWPLNPRRVRRLNGDDSLTFQYPKTGLYAGSFLKGYCVREILSADGSTNVIEWIVDRYTPATGDNPLMSIACLSPILRLLNYPISQTDADGVVYRDVAAIQLPASTVMASYILSNTPAWVTAGTLSPSNNQELPFSDDNALSGMRRWEEYAHLETEFLRVGLTGYTLGIVARGATAPTLYLQTGKNIRSWQPEYGNGTHRNRIDTVVGATGDFGSAGLGLAYWEVVSITGAGPYTLVLKSIHGGAGPVQFDNQFNHSGLPGGANSLYLEKRNRTFTQITGSNAAAQSLTIASNTTITAGDWVRIVASSAGKFLTFLDSPVDMAANQLVTGKFESGWDDALSLCPNAMQVTWTTPSAAPDGWVAGAGTTLTQLTAANTWLTGGKSWQVQQVVSAPTVMWRSPPKDWYVAARQSTYYVTAWIRVTQNTSAASGVGIDIGLYSSGSLLGAAVAYIGPLNVWRQIKIEGLDLSAYVGTTLTLDVRCRGYGPTTSTVTMTVDSVNFGPGLAVRPMTWGSNAARIWQDANLDLNDTKAVPVSRRGSILDLASMNSTSAEAVVLGGTVVVRADELTEASDVTARIVELDEVPGSPELTEVVVSTLPVTLSRKQSKPLPLTIPFFEAEEIRAVDRDNRQAALLVKAAITATTSTQVTITLTATDSLGAGVFVTYAASAGVTYVSGSGIGPYVFTRPANGAGVGRVVFTGQVAGRADVYDAVDVPEKAPVGFTIRETFTETDTSATLTVVISDDPGVRVTGVKFATQSGNTAMGAFGAEDTSVPYSQSVTYVEKQPSKIAYQVMGTDSGGTAAQILYEGLVTFKPSTKPGIPAAWVDIDSNSLTAATSRLRVEGDNDTLSIRWAVSTSAMPSNATVDAASGSNVNARVLGGTTPVATGVTIGLDGVIYLKARAYSAINAGGQASDPVEVILRRDSINFTKTLRIGFGSFVPLTMAEQLVWSPGTFGGIHPAVTGSLEYALASVVLPKGCTLTACRIRYRRASASEVLTIDLDKHVDSTTTNLATTAGATGTSWATHTFSGLSQLVGDEAYTLTIGMNSSTTVADCRVQWIELDYTMPSYDKGY